MIDRRYIGMMIGMLTLLLWLNRKVMERRMELGADDVDFLVVHLHHSSSK